jgi:pimeloyl-ACP methyl ester carboxylesterase
MRTYFRHIILGLFLCTPVLSMGQKPVDRMSGSWMGKLEVSGTQLRIIFHIKVDDQAKMSATLDSPDQGARGIGMGEVTLQGDSLTIEAPVVMGSYKGIVTSDTTIAGSWQQAGGSFPLDLKKQQQDLVLNRPQEPHPPYPYIEEEVSFLSKAGTFSLGGTLTLPAGEGPFPAVVLVSGSGSQNRDEEIFGHRPFKVIADFLTRKGIMVLRYDDRGVGSSGGNPSGATSADNAADARGAFEYLLHRREVDPQKVGVIGHSEGGMIAMMLAAEYPDVDFIITLAGPGVDGKTLLLDQSEYISRLSGIPDSVVEDNRLVMRRVYDLMISNETRQGWAREVLEFTSEHYRHWVSADFTEEDIEKSKTNLLGSVPESAYPWMRFFVMFDPSEILDKVHCPVLALNGQKDCQVLAEKNLGAIREDLISAGNTLVTTRIFPGLNHLFQPCETGLPGEYGTIEITFDPEVMSLMVQWIREL